jgi:hypothetical protein
VVIGKQKAAEVIEVGDTLAGGVEGKRRRMLGYVRE